MTRVSTLRDLGERAIIRTILPKFAQGIGDDCCVLPPSAGSLVITTDPVPVPAAKLIGADEDLYWVGRLLVTINASDLAAAGASPLAFLAAIDCPADLAIRDFERLLTGIRDACLAEGLRYGGGNLRESKSLAAVGTAVGFCTNRPLTRSGAQVGDIVVSIGQGGRFWRDALLVLNGEPLFEKGESPLFACRSQMKTMSALAEQGIVKAAIDNSDGLLPSLELLAEANHLAIEVNTSSLAPPPGKLVPGVDPARLWLGWGDWNVIVSVSPSKVTQVQRIAELNSSIAIPLGTFGVAAAGVYLTRKDQRIRAPRLESERFAPDSWFSKGIEQYIELLLSSPLP